jgi:hypothetical protein
MISLRHLTLLTERGSMQTDFKTQLSGLNDFLKAAYGAETQLNTLLAELGFERTQVELLDDEHLGYVVSQFVDAIREKLTSSGVKSDHLFQVLCRRYGLDGEASETLESIAKKHGISAQYARQLEADAFQKCRSKTTRSDFNKSLQHIVVAELSKIAPPPTRQHVSEKLFRLTNLQAATDLTRMDYEEKRSEILKQVQAELDALDVEYKPLLEAAEENMATLTAEIKNDVLLHGDSVQGGAYRAMYMQGRASWDNTGMTKYAVAHPDVLKFRKQGQPSVTLRIVEEKK